jgi:tetratricopeptide (TPR) repeat protein
MTDDVSMVPEQFTTFGALLRFLRVRAHLSQRDLSLAVGYSEAHLSRLEAGKRRPDPDVVRAHLLPALDLDNSSPWARRLLLLATMNSQPQAEPAEPPAPQLPPAPSFVSPGTGGLAADLLATKLYRPRARPRQVVRPRLMATLDAVLDLPLAVVVAPAGFGKTALLAAWLEGKPFGGFLALDSDDNDPVRFLRYVLATLHQVAPQLGTHSLPLLEAPGMASASLVQPLLNELAALPHPVVLVLDDYHVIVNPVIHELLSLICERLPPQAHFVLASREDPPLPLARLRARGLLVELRAAQLRFRGDEVGSFLRETMALQLSDQDATTLEARTEGWAVGLQLAALALREAADPARLVAAFAGTNRYVIDYLTEEVLARLPAHLLRFLVQTSFLERLSGPLCDAVLGVDSDGGDSYSRLLLMDLEQRSLFLVPLDSERRCYRYHHLFAEVLRTRLHEGLPAEQVQHLYQRAAQAECVREYAVGYLLAGKLWDEAATRLAALGSEQLALGQHATLAGWLSRMPIAELNQRPYLQVLYGVALSRLGQFAQAEALLKAGHTGCRQQGDADGELLALTELGLLLLVRGELAEVLERFQEVLTLTARPVVRVYTLVCAMGAFTLGERRDLVERSATELFALVEGSDDHELLASALIGGHSLAVIVVKQLSALETLCRRGLILFGGQESLVTVSASAALAQIAWQRGRVTEAFERSLAVAQAWERFGVYGSLAPQMLTIAGGCTQLWGDGERAIELFTAALQASAQEGIYRTAQSGMIYILGRAFWQQGKYSELRALEERLANVVVTGSMFVALTRSLLRALLALADERYEEAQQLLERVAAQEDSVLLIAVHGSARPLLAHLALRRGDRAAAAAALAPLLAICAHENRPGRLLFEGPYVLPLLEAAVAEEVQQPFAAHVLALSAAAQVH